jgi:hypothetical protein
MTPEELVALKSIFVGFSAGALVAAGVGYLLVKHFLSSYLTEKGRNFATREDIEEITRKVEGVRTQYVSLVEELKARHQLRLAAVDRRLQAHQDAFTLWRKLLAVTHTEEASKVVIECQTWWEENCIYLEPDVREGFLVAYGAANSHNALLKGRAEVSLIQSNWKLITEFPNLLFKAVQLPALSELEAKALGMKEGSAP